MQKIRLEHAESMLEHTDKTVDEIMHTVGYNNKRYFYKIFQQKNDTPHEKYRQTHRKPKMRPEDTMIFIPFSYDKDREVNVKIYTYQNHEKGAHYEQTTS